MDENIDEKEELMEENKKVDGNTDGSKEFEPREATDTDAGSGQGTVSGPPKGETQDRPILDGSTLSDEEERQVENPRRGMEDPGLIRDVEDEKKSMNPYG